MPVPRGRTERKTPMEEDLGIEGNLAQQENPNVPTPEGGPTPEPEANQATSQNLRPGEMDASGSLRTAEDTTPPNSIPGAAQGAQQHTISLNENQRNVYVPGQFRNNPEAFQFDQAQKWADLYGGQAGQHGTRAEEAWNQQAQARAGQAQAINDAWARQGQMYGAADAATQRMQQAQESLGGVVSGAGSRIPGMESATDQATAQMQRMGDLTSGIASGQATTPGGVGQASAQQLALNAASGNGPTAAQAQFQRNLDQSISATRSALAGQRGLSRGAAARIGAQSVSDLGLKSAADAAALRAQEQQAGMQLAGGITGQARGQDLQAAGLGAQTSMGLQGQLAGQEAAARDRQLQASGLGAQIAMGTQGQLAQQAATNLATTGNLANQLRTADTGLYGGEINAQQMNQGMGMSLDQQQLALKQQQEQADYNKWRDWNNWIVTQYGGAGNYQAPWQDQAWMGMGAGLVSGLASGGIDWLTRGAGGGAASTTVPGVTYAG